MAEITVKRGGGDRFQWRFHVVVREGDSATEHEVSLSATDFERLGAGREPEEFLRTCFAFLLDREPKESILPSFDVSVIGRYFPEFERVVAGG